MTGYLLGGLLLTVVPVRVCIAAAGLSGLSLTAGFALPLLRAAGRDRHRDREGDGDQETGHDAGARAPASVSARPARPR
jgi:hypothetical protein